MAEVQDSRVFLLPDLGEGLTEAELVRWLVAEGEEISVDQPVAEVETAKSLVEVPTPFAGVVARLHGAAGELMDVGKPFLTVRTGESAPVADPSSVTVEPTAPDHHEGYREEERAGSGNVLIGYGTSAEGRTGRSRPAKRSQTAQSSGPAQKMQPSAAAIATSSTVEVSGGPIQAPLVISPLVRKLARDLGISLATIAGSGPGGLILRADVLGQRDAVAQSGGEVDVTTGEQEIDGRSGLAVLSRTPLTGVRRTIANAMTRSRSEIPEATVWVDVDATALLELRSDLKRRDPEGTPSLLAFIARFVLAGLARFPELNSRIVTDQAQNQQILSVSGVNLGFAAQTERGLLVPAIRAAERLNARQLDTEIARLTALARAGKATAEELSSGTFTLNNYGVFGVDGSAAIINYPEAAILGVGRIIDKPWVVNGALAVRKMTELTLVFDHRVCDGGSAGGFLRFVADAMENPAALLAEL
ncbi:dihydrolipoamide acetyltransferase family protein [Psychromicrobium lacuslunae]|uniref:Dihydrolipoamide acetyltransferase component of pyruvate dehydrogenase complex n=1 Tax=Psychromicrobium lacuslunae TaxID=1618207 RepID=A0A0D4BZK9_9MICC|nr:dihydrolipoamide acetyltransferase family protein [Psychromicrobium lacuslunae]AJT41887.1 branched-chain alpha-keto acid dehydrogenase subunit E2 [Psychromicrobium lacuslunae]